MQGSSHIRLGKWIGAEYGMTGRKLAAFIWGNIEPDLAVPSHLGHAEGIEGRLEGHSYPAAAKKAVRLYRKLENGCRTAEDYFLLGKLCHSLADSFTWAHNPDYPGTLSALISYERQMDRVMMDGVMPVHFPEIEAQSFPEAFASLHAVYETVSPSIVRDLSFIMAAAELGCRKVLEKEPARGTRRRALQKTLAAAVSLPVSGHLTGV